MLLTVVALRLTLSAVKTERINFNTLEGYKFHHGPLQPTLAYKVRYYISFRLFL